MEELKKDLDFTTDLDKVNEKLFGLRTRGGEEYVARVCRDAIQQLDWSKDAGALKLIEGLAGGVPGGRSIKFFIPGGASSPWLMPEHLDEPTDMDHVQNDLKSMLGSGAIMVFDETTDPLLVAWRLAKFFAHESCGKCTPCREGSGWIEKILYRMSHGLGRPDDLDLMLDFGDNVVPGLNAPFAQTTICALGPSIMSHVVSLDRYFRDEIAERMGADTRTRIPVAAPGGGGR